MDHRWRAQDSKSGSAPDLASSAPLTEEEAAYFSELLGYSMERLAREPELLASEQEYLVRQASEAVSTHRRALVAGASADREVGSQLAAACDRLAALSAALPAVRAAGEAFERAAERAAAARRATGLLAAHHGALLDVLEVPSLMLTCVRNRHYDEALDLRAFADEALDAMRDALLRGLEGEAALPECLRAVGFLRRLGGFSERGLRLELLARRDAWVVTAARGAGLGDADAPPYEALKRATDALRLQLSDVAGQYLAMFGGADGEADGIADGDADDVLPRWARRRVEAYLALVAHHLPRLADGGALASIWEAAMYAGASLARVGLDLRPLLADGFEGAVAGVFEAGVAGAEAACRRLAAQGAWAGLRRAGEGEAAPPEAGAAAPRPRRCSRTRRWPCTPTAWPPPSTSLRAVREVAATADQPEAAAAVGAVLTPFLAGNLARVFGTTPRALGIDVVEGGAWAVIGGQGSSGTPEATEAA
ncbi:hypothetical protein QBZ16_003314 [Prototheca wickerhamii]|uniref:Conserved oligomeric Golgi complex subunit 8 n=1 Tax=Prototheca wickerhamii TaxID=3111 RepID=A0AAD9IJT1_PROWI|nr:hypothetical protein QBZ16_003314 [Prototheca wickerhamii]